jgi:DNA polymerase-4
MPIATAVRLCPDAMYVPVPGKACGVKHREVRAALDVWSPVVEPASIDEFYLDLSGTEAAYRGESLEDTARRMRDDVRARTGLTLSVGGGTNRLVAKLAAERAKPRTAGGGTGVRIVPLGAEAEFLAGHALAEIPGVGPKLQAALGRFGLVSVKDALRVRREDFQQWLGPGSGEWLYERIRGRGSNRVQPDADARSMSREETFARDLVSEEALETRLLELVTRLAAELRAEGLAARTVTVKLRDHDFRTRQASVTLPVAVSTGRAIFEVARERLRSLRAKRRVAARLLGVALTGLRSSAADDQFSLLDHHSGRHESDRDRELARAVDQINKKLGTETVRPARLVDDRT